MDLSYAFLKQTLSAWPFIVQIFLWGYSMRLTWMMALRWDKKHIARHLPQTIQIELSEKDMKYAILEAENKKLRDACDRLWVDNKMIDKAKVKK